MKLENIFYKKKGNKKPNKRLSPFKPSYKLSQEYQSKMLSKIIKPMAREYQKDILKLKGIKLENQDKPTKSKVKKTVEKSLKNKPIDIEEIATEIAVEFVLNSNSQHSDKFLEAVEKSFSIDINGIIESEGLSSQIKEAIDENVKLITNLSEYEAEVVANKVYKQIEEGGRIEEAIQEAIRVSSSRARLIAEDQANKIFGRLDQIRQENIGITKYEWYVGTTQ